MNSLVNWSQWDATEGRVAKGQMPLATAVKQMHQFGMAAKLLLESTNVDHVLYGLMIYDGDDVSAVQFYMNPMNDKEFDKNCGRIRNAMVYAVHRNRR